VPSTTEQGALTALAQIAAQELDIPFEMVKMIPQTNTETNPYDWKHRGVEAHLHGW